MIDFTSWRCGVAQAARSMDARTRRSLDLGVGLRSLLAQRSNSFRQVQTQSALLAAVGLLSLAGCSVPTSLDTPESAARIRATQIAAASNDPESTPKLISLLDSDDSAVRFFAIGALERRTSQRFGYDACAEESERRAAVSRWREWYESTQSGAAGGRRDAGVTGK